MPWPALTDFSEAVQNPAVCFRGTELEAAQVAVNQRGLPLVFSGSFACVYSASVSNRKFAVRCFTREIKDQQSRYEQLSNYLINVLPPAFVYFEYLDHGINFRGDWYPIVRMEWVEGEPLSRFVGSRLDQPDVLRRTAAQWRGGTTASLRGLRIAHNDLQHGNVMVEGDGNIRLVDYDGMFLPQFRGERSPELGHKNYQHPLRTSEDYDDYVDNFPTLVIYTSLLAIASDAGLWSFFNDDNLIFTRDDYAAPKQSEIFNRLKNSLDPTVSRLTERLEECCALPVGEVPDLETILQGIPVRTAPPSPSPPPAAAPPQLHPPPAAVPTGNSMGYRQMLQAQTGASAPPAPAMERQCPHCKSRNARTRRDWYRRRNALRCLSCNGVFGKTIIKRCPGCGSQDARLRSDWYNRDRPFRCSRCNAVFGGTDQTPPRQPVVGGTPNLVSYLTESTVGGTSAEGLMDRARGVMLGVAVGNLLGLPVEGRSRQRIQELYPAGVRDIEPAEASRQMDDDPAQARGVGGVPPGAGRPDQTVRGAAGDLAERKRARHGPVHPAVHRPAGGPGAALGGVLRRLPGERRDCIQRGHHEVRAGRLGSEAPPGTAGPGHGGHLRSLALRSGLPVVLRHHQRGGGRTCQRQRSRPEKGALCRQGRRLPRLDGGRAGQWGTDRDVGRCRRRQCLTPRPVLDARQPGSERAYRPHAAGRVVGGDHSVEL